MLTSEELKEALEENTLATMDKWQLEVYEKLKPLEKIMLEHVKTGKVLNMDETTTQILHYENRNSSRKKSYIWLAHGGPKDKPLAIYRYFESRSPQYIRTFLKALNLEKLLITQLKPGLIVFPHRMC